MWIWVAIVVSGLGTFLMRASFLLVAGRVPTVSPGIERALRHVPSAALAALVVPAIVRPGGQLDLTGGRVWVGLVAAVVAWRTRSVTLTMVLGVVLLVVVEAS